MSTLQTTQSTTTQPRDTKPITPILRSPRAADAPRFAQVLQGFDQDERSLVVESASKAEAAPNDEGIESSTEETTDDADLPHDQKSVRSDTPNGDQQGDEGTQQGEPESSKNGLNGVETRQGGAEASGGTEAAQSIQVSADGKPESGVSAQNSDGQAVEITKLDPLQNKSDQAKLSIKGFVRAARADAAPDLTTLAVQTRLGEIEPIGPRDQSRPINPQASNDGIQPGGVRPSPTPISDPTHNPLDSISDTPPEPTKGKGNGAGIRIDPNQPTPASDVSRTKIDPTQIEGQQQRSVRSETAASIASTREQPITTRADALQSLIRSGANARAEGAISTRAVTAVEGGARAGIDSSTTRATQSPSPVKSDQGGQQEKMIAQVQRGLASLLRSSDSEMTLRLTPERLGELRIQIKRDGDRIALRLTAQSAEARDLLQSGSDELARALQSKGVQVERVLIEYNSPGPGDQGGFDADGNHSQDHGADQRHHGSRDHTDQPDLFASIDGDPAAVGQRSIWTELGLDAIA